MMVEMNKETKIDSGPGKKGKGRWIAIAAIIVVALVIVSAFALTNGSNKKSDGTTGIGTVTDNNMTTLSIPLSSISTTATWFEYNISGATVRFFAVMDSNGTVHVAFDECPLCYESHLGFTQEGSVMMENCCKMPFDIDRINAENCTGDDCYPIFLPTTIEGDQLIIKKSTLSDKRFIFLEADESAKVAVYDATHIYIPLSGVSQNATWYQYTVNGTAVRFFAVMDTDGVVHTSMDICPKCYKKHAGFRQQDEINMVENCCNMAFKIANITQAGCNITVCHPANLVNQIIGDKVVIAIADLEAGAYMFVKT